MAMRKGSTNELAIGFVKVCSSEWKMKLHLEKNLDGMKVKIK